MRPMRKKTGAVFVWLATFLLFVPRPAAAYLDPGTGSMFLQGLIAVIGATLATVGIYWRATRDLLRRLLRRKPDSTPDGPARS